MYHQPRACSFTHDLITSVIFSYKMASKNTTGKCYHKHSILDLFPLKNRPNQFDQNIDRLGRWIDSAGSAGDHPLMSIWLDIHCTNVPMFLRGCTFRAWGVSLIWPAERKATALSAEKNYSLPATARYTRVAFPPWTASKCNYRYVKEDWS